MITALYTSQQLLMHQKQPSLL